MDRIEQLRKFISDAINPCKLPPNKKQPISIPDQPRTRISRSQVIAIGIMSITTMGLLVVLSVPIIIAPTQTPLKYNTENVIVKFNEGGDPIWDTRISIANASSKIHFEPDSICIIDCKSGGYAVASPIRCQRNETNTWGVLLCRIDESGAVVWKRIYDELDIELGLSLIEIQSGRFVVAGTIQFRDEESNSWVQRVFLIYTDHSDDSYRILDYPELTGVRLHSLVRCANGDLAIVGTTEIHSDNGSNVLLARVAENGTLCCKTFIGDSLNDEGNSLIECSDGGFIVVGSTQIDSSNKDVLIVRTSIDGSIIWNRTYEDEGISVGWSVCATNDGGCAVTGLRRLSSREAYKTLFLVVGPNGDEITRKPLYYPSQFRSYGFYDDCRGHAIVQTDDDGFIIAGMVRYNHLIDEWGMMILKTDASGNLLSNSTYGRNSWQMACSIVACEDRGCVVAGVRINPTR
ncbi:MAG: hypothetical protein ACFFBL_08285 [Promethearchaeota archaeon]